jgi:hypothetical protein
LLKDAILAVVSDAGEGVLFKDLIRLVKTCLDADQLGRLGSLGWYTTTIKLDLEVKGDIRWVAGFSPQRLVG